MKKTRKKTGSRIQSLSQVFSKEEIKKHFHFGKMSRRQGILAILAFGIFFAGYATAVGRYHYIRWTSSIPEPRTFEELRKEQLEKKVKEMVKGTPMEIMAPFIAEKDKKTAAFLVGIAKKESNWGKRKPVLDGEDCFNYWGYRGKSETMGSGGHTCFGSPEEAVSVVSKRIEQIIKKNNVESAKNMIVWKCGYTCVAHSPESVSKWIRDVDFYTKKILN